MKKNEDIEEKKKVEKKIKSVNLSVSKIERVDNYTSTNGGSFSDVVEKGLDLYFEALEKGNNKILDSLGLEDPDTTIYVPISLYITMSNSSFTQVTNMANKNKLTIATMTDKNGNESSKAKYVAISDRHPDFHLAKVTMMGETVKNLSKQITAIKEESNTNHKKLELEISRLKKEIKDKK